MGIGCVLGLWAVLAAIAGAVAAIGVFVYLRSSRSEATFGMIVGGLLAAGGSVVATGAVIFIAAWLFWGMWPHETTSPGSFKDAFGFAAGPDVTAVRSRTVGSTDSHEQFLRFQAGPQTIATIVSTRFKRSSADACRQELRQRNDDAPAWWRPSDNPQSECYVAHPFDQSFASNSAWLMYDRSSGQAYFHYLGID